MWDYRNFWNNIIKDWSFITNTLSIIIAFTCRNSFQNFAIDISEKVNMIYRFLSNRSKFCVVRIIRFCQIMPVCRKNSKYLQYFELILLVTTMSTWKSLNVKIRWFTNKIFLVTIANADIIIWNFISNSIISIYDTS